MKTRVTLDRTGRITILKQLRKELHLEPGDALEIESSDGQITLRPVRRKECRSRCSLRISLFHITGTRRDELDLHVAGTSSKCVSAPKE
jgi:AbrB family looped-hinge helix DNA binding protein